MATVRLRQRKDGSVYTQVRYRLDGVESSASFNDHAEAMRFCELATRAGPAKAIEVWRVERNLAAGMTVEEWLAHHIDHLTGVTKTTLWDYRSYVRNDIKQSLGAIPLAALSRDDIARWVQDMAATGAAGKTIANKHGFLSAALGAAVKAGRISSNPAAGTRLPETEKPEMVFLSREEFAQLLAAVREPWRPLVEFLVASGARFGEAAALKPGDVDRTAGTVRIQRAWKRTYAKGGYELGPPKTKKSVRTINVPASVLGKLDYSHEWLFVNRIGAPVRVVGFRNRVWYPALERAKLKRKPRVHDLRHTHASWLIADGIPLPVIQRRLGHESIQTTVDVYGHLDRESDEAAATAIAAALNLGGR